MLSLIAIAMISTAFAQTADVPSVDTFDRDLARLARAEKLLPLPMVYEYLRRHPQRDFLPNGKSVEFFRKYTGHLPYEKCVLVATDMGGRLAASAVVGTESLDSYSSVIRCESPKLGVAFEIPVGKLRVSTLGLSLGVMIVEGRINISKLTGHSVSSLFSTPYTGMTYGIGFFVGTGYFQASNPKGIRLSCGGFRSGFLEVKVASATAQFDRREHLYQCGSTAWVLGAESIPTREDSCRDYAEEHSGHLDVDWSKINDLIFWYVGN